MLKLDELADRLGVGNIAQIHDLAPTTAPDEWQRLLGFFGVDYRAVGGSSDPAQAKIAPNFGLFPHQRDVAERTLRFALSPGSRAILHLPTGAGKTRTAMHVVSRFLLANEPSTVVWLAGSAELLHQAADAFASAWSSLGNRHVTLTRFWSDYTADLTTSPDGLVVAGLQKLYSWQKAEWIAAMRFAKSVNLVVVDEAHQAVAPTYRDLVEMLANTGFRSPVIGLTATPGRTWSNIEEDEKLSELFHGNKISLQVAGASDPISFLIKEGYLARPRFRQLFTSTAKVPNGPTMAAAKGGLDYAVPVLERLGEDTGRNVLIVDEVRRLVADGHRRIILFASSVRNAQVLAVALSSVEVDARVLTGETPRASRESLIAAYRRPTAKPMVLCNFGVLTTGFDSPRTSATVIARPTKSLVLFSQMVGRAIRGPRAGGNETCDISTVVDLDLPGFGDIAEAFSNWEDVWE